MNEHADFVSRAGGKLAHALDVFEVRPVGWICADLGSHVGGFVDCLLRRGAVRVYAVDTAYGTLAWRLRRDDRVVVRERTNALHVALPEPVDLVTIDVGWTRQLRILDHARNLLAEDGRIITLIKPQYEAEPPELQGGVVREACLDAVSNRVRDQVAALGLTIDGWVDSPLIGHGGNREMLALLRRAARASWAPGAQATSVRHRASKGESRAHCQSRRAADGRRSRLIRHGCRATVDSTRPAVPNADYSHRLLSGGLLVKGTSDKSQPAPIHQLLPFICT